MLHRLTPSLNTVASGPHANGSYYAPRVKENGRTETRPVGSLASTLLIAGPIDLTQLHHIHSLPILDDCKGKSHILALNNDLGSVGKRKQKLFQMIGAIRVEDPQGLAQTRPSRNVFLNFVRFFHKSVFLQQHSNKLFRSTDCSVSPLVASRRSGCIELCLCNSVLNDR
ncbi:uncharacterized protein LAJ45_02916 [Morchella importuna]|uniref:uncharacterized protein n=1 Tax=Morchella importuna TaxID=1174673 RepID=UPI001E8D77E4|nr:uncharacterized protein LAJ45_02916 [Morchella importuna]KAH8153329.1 hypothetical protein LAJ45_02916 [Morchella importuna]